MSSHTTVGTLVLAEESHASDRLFAQLARTLASSGPAAGVAIERHVGCAASYVVARPATLLRSIDPPTFRSVRLRSADPPFADAPPPGWSERFGVLILAAEEDRPVRQSPGTKVAPPGLPNPMTFGRDLWIATRTYWVARSGGGLWAARVYRLGIPGGTGSEERTARAVGAMLAQQWSARMGRPSTARPLPTWRAGRAWRTWSTDAAPREAWTSLPLDRALISTEVPSPAVSLATLARGAGHLSVFGTSGAGKTTFLAELAAGAIRRGDGVVALDTHGDLTPGILARLAPGAHERVLAIDIADRPAAGIQVLGGKNAAPEDRAVAHLVGALKRLTPDGEAIYWGFRLERIYDAFIRLVQEEGGTLVDLVDALESPQRREALRATTRRPELARFLDELLPVLRRQPDFLWSAASRLAKIVLIPGLRELLAPDGSELPWEEGLRRGRSVLVRLPFAEIGSEAASLASTLLLSRIYLAHASQSSGAEARRPLWLLLDEAQMFSPRLLAEILTEGRKFGVRAVVATQYPERLSSEVDHALRGAVGTHVCFRVPQSNARATAEWLGVDAVLPAEQLCVLPTGTAISVGRKVEALNVARPPSDSGLRSWSEVVQRSRVESGVAPATPLAPEGDPALEEAVEALLLSVWSAQEPALPVSEASAVQAAATSLAGREDIATVSARWRRLVNLRWVLPVPSGWTLGSAGAEALGIGRRTGATRETGEHRALLLETFRIFARRGCRLEILRQGRFDTTLPDARLELMRSLPSRSSPAEVARHLDQARAGWAWRFFHGRNVNVEAEVSGALRSERVRHGCRKALREGAFALFVVSDALRARRVRAVLRAMDLGPDRAQVWTLPGALRARGRSTRAS